MASSVVSLGLFHISLSSVSSFQKTYDDNFDTDPCVTDLSELTFEAKSSREGAW